MLLLMSCTEAGRRFLHDSLLFLEVALNLISGSSHFPTGAAKLLHFPLFTGTPVVVMPRFDPVAFCAHIEKHNITAALVVPPMLLSIIRHPG
jgi:hypothetical protein